MTLPEPLLGGRTSWLGWNHGRIAVESTGDGSLVVLIHPPEIGASRYEWRELVPRLVAGGHRAVAFDLLGFGQSDCPRHRYDADLYIQLIQAILDQFRVDPLHLIARRHAAAYATSLAASQPGRVRSLTLITPHGMAPDRTSDDNYRWYTQPVLGRARYAFLTTPRVQRASLAADGYFDPRRVTREEVALAVRSARRRHAHYPAAALFAGYLDRDVRLAWIALELPILLLWGEACERPPLDDAEKFLLPLRPDAPLMMIRGDPVGVRKDNVVYKTYRDTRQRPHVEAADAVAADLLEHLAAAEG